MSIFKQNYLQYLKAGYSVIPDKKGKDGKKPAIKNWNAYSEKMPTKEDIISWIKIKDANISVMLGKQSGIIALDFDETDPEIKAMILPLLPASPVERIGKKGFVRFFQYSGQPNQEIFRVIDDKKKVSLELLCNRKKVTIPPSIHPETNKPYTWTEKSLLDVDPSFLPKFPPMLFAHIQSKMQIFETNSYNSAPKITEGRNISLSTYVGKLIRNPHTILDAVENLIAFDKKNHDKPLFTDQEENEIIDVQYNALMFYMNHLKFINTKRANKQEGLELPIFNSEVSVFENLIKNKNTIKTKLPKPSGLMKEIYDYILERSYIEQPIFALSASIALLGTLASRKLIFQNSTPNCYILNIADSGSGKDSCIQVIKGLLVDIGASQKLLGATSYPSEASIIRDLDVNPVRLDIIDECSTFLSAATKGGNNYAQGIGDTLCELFSCSNSYYLGKALASSNTNVGAVHRPHINLLCSTTYRGVQESISITSLEKGLFSRFLVFFGNNNVSGKRIIKSNNPPKELLDRLKYWAEFTNPNIIIKGNLTPFNLPAYKVPCTPISNDLLTEYHLHFDKMRLESKSDNFHRPIISRLFQHMLKITLISAVGNTEVNEKPVVRPIDVGFAYQMVNYFYDHIIDFVKDNLYESERGRKSNKILNIIKKADDEGITNIQLAQKCKFLSTHERIDIIKDLKEANQISIQSIGEDEEGQLKFFYLG